ncbi:hypothetical protein V8J38_16835 (plasmid) [Brevundimonas olei]|uniref:Uncharacterized protein n=1 Tax=Brevundimonas olei TaxID=657642 RepID=A0ABZ2IHJ3_9CAUL
MTMKNMKYDVAIALACLVLAGVIGAAIVSSKKTADQKASEAAAEAFFEMPAADYRPKTY